MKLKNLLFYLLFAGCNSELVRNIPDQGVGKLLVSHDTNHKRYNDRRFMVIFDLDCLGDDSSTEHIDPQRTSTNQQTKVDSIINGHYPCLSHHNKKNYQLYSTGYGLSFLNIDDDSCLDNEHIELDYNEHCIHSITHEPTFSLNQFGEDWNQLTTDDYSCTTQDTSASALPSGSAWGLDQLDSFNANNKYIHPDISFDNGVDLYIIDSGVASSHDEFVDNNVYHMLGDGAATYVVNDSLTYYQSHGTHVCGTAAGVNYGVSKNLDIYDYRVCTYTEYGQVTHVDDIDCYTNLITEALLNISSRIGNESPKRRGVINMSLSGSRSFFDFIWEYYFGKINDNGGISVVAAGNDGTDACYYSPAWTTEVITVGASSSGYHSTWFSNWGSCVDVWAPGVNVTSSVADCDSCYEAHSGTSMASPHIAGYVANLLWVDPTLKLYEIKSLLMKNTTTVAEWPCNLESFSQYCQYSFYDGCDTIPSNWYGDGNTIAPATTPENTDVSSYVGYPSLDAYVSNDCNILAELEIHPTHKDSSNPMNYSVIGITYEPLNQCLNEKIDYEDYLSYAFKCLTDTSAEVLYYTQEDCSSIPMIAKVIYHGQVEGDFWYYVDCSKESYESGDYIIDDDNNECDLKYRTWYPQDFVEAEAPTTDDENYEAEIECVFSEDTATYYDSGKVMDACYFSTNASGDLSSYYWSCMEDEYVSLHEFDNGDCSGDERNVTYYYQGCYYSQFTGFGYYLDIIDCANSIDTKAPSNQPTSNPTYSQSFVYIDGEEPIRTECTGDDCTDYGTEWTTDTIEGTSTTMVHLLTFEQRPEYYVQSMTYATYSLEYVGYTNTKKDSLDASYFVEYELDSLNTDESDKTTEVFPAVGTVNVSAVDSDPFDEFLDISGNFGSQRLEVVLDTESTNNYEVFKVTLTDCTTDATFGCSVVNPRYLYLFIGNEVSTKNTINEESSSSGGGNNNNGLSLGALIGIIAGGVCLLILIIVAIVFVCRRRNDKVSYDGKQQGNQGLLKKENDPDYKPPEIEIGRSDDIDGVEDKRDVKVY